MKGATKPPQANKPQAAGTAATTTDESHVQHYYNLRDTPINITKMLSIFEALEKKLGKEKLASKLSILPLLFLSYAAYVVSNHMAATSYITLGITLISVLSYFLIYIVLRVFSRSRAVNPSDLSRTQARGKIFFLIVGLLIMFSVGAPFFSLILSTLPSLPSILTNPIPILLICISAALGILAASQFLTIRRYNSVAPHPFEIFFISELLRPLLLEVPTDLRCSVTCNPFPSNWSQQTVKGKGPVKDATFDCILKARLPLGGERSINVSVMHRVSQKGQRKFKGYKHKIKTIYTFCSPEISSRSGKNLQADFKSLLTKMPPDSKIIDKNPFAFLGTPEALPTFKASDGSISAVEVYSTIKSFSAEFAAPDLIHPKILLWRIKALSEMVIKNTQSKKAAATGASPS